MTTKENMILLLRRIMTINSLTEVEIPETMQRKVLWYDNGGRPSEDAITKLLWDGEELGLELSTFGGNVTVYEDDAAFNDPEALHEVLGSVFMTVCEMPEIIYSDEYSLIEDLFWGIFGKWRSRNEAHEELMDIARYIAAERLKEKYNEALEYFITGKDNRGVAKFKIEFQKEADDFCRKEYDRYAAIFANGTDENGMIVLPYLETTVYPECPSTVKSKCCKHELGSLKEKYTELNEEVIQTVTGIVTTNGGSLESVNKTSYPIHMDNYADSRLQEIFVTPNNNRLVLKMGEFEDNLMIGPPFYLPADLVSAEQLLHAVRFMLSENERCDGITVKTCSYAD